MPFSDQPNGFIRIAGKESMCAGDVESSLQKEVEVEQLTPWLILWRFEIFNGAVINDSVALFEIRRNEDEFPRRVIHVVDSSAGLPRPHDCIADFDVQWYLAPLILDLTSR